MTQIFSQTASADPASAFGSSTLPNFDGALGEWWLGDDAAASRLNWINGVNSTVVGAPAYHAGYATVGNAGNVPKGFEADVGAVSGAVTMLALARGVAATVYIAAPYDPADAQAVSLNYNLIVPTNVTDFSAGNGHRSGATDQAILASPDPAKFTFIQGVYLPSTPGRLYLMDDAAVLMDDGGAAYTPANRDTHVIRIGAFPDINFQGEVDVAAVALFDGNKGQAFFEEVYPLWKAYAESRGLAVN